MTDSLTASIKWCRYDDDFKERNGFRLPAGKAFSRTFLLVQKCFPSCETSRRSQAPISLLLLLPSKSLITDSHADSNTYQTLTG